MITAIDSPIGKTLTKILIQMGSFPLHWNLLRNFKLLIDRWAETMNEGSEDYKKICHMFVTAYFDDKVHVSSKSSSTVFNPIFITKAYSKIYSSELLNFVEDFVNRMNDHFTGIIKPKESTKAEFDITISKIILFMSARLKFPDANKISEHLRHIYENYAHFLPSIYKFRTWIYQTSLVRIPLTKIESKLI